MPDTRKTFSRNFLVLFTGNSVGQLIPFLLAPFIARIFTPDQLGVQENFLAIASLFSIIAAGRYDLAIVLPREKADAVRLLRLSLIITCGISLLSLMVVLFPRALSGMYNDAEAGKYMIFLAPGVFLLSLVNIFTQWSIRTGAYRFVTGSRILQSLVQHVGYLLLGYAGWGIMGLFVAWLAGVLLSSLVLLRPAFKTITLPEFKAGGLKKVAGEYRDFPMVNTLHAFTDIFATQFLIYWLITRNYGVFYLGLFAIMNRYLRAPLNLVGSAVSQLYYKDAGSSLHQHLNPSPIYNRSVRTTFFLAFPVLLSILLWGPWLFATYLGPAWREAGEYARIMAPAILFNFMASVVSATPLLYKRQKTAYLLSLCGYGISCGVLVFGSVMQYAFNITLVWYSTALSLYYISLLLWYRSLLRNTVP